MELYCQPLDLLINRVRQLHFGLFHAGNVTRLGIASKARLDRIRITKHARVGSCVCQTCKYMGVDFLAQTPGRMRCPTSRLLGELQLIEEPPPERFFRLESEGAAEFVRGRLLLAIGSQDHG